MSKLIFCELAKDNADDIAEAKAYFGDDADVFLSDGYRYILGYRDGVPIVGATTDFSFSDFDLESNESMEVYQAMIEEIERLAISIGTSSINTIAEAIQHRPKFIAALFLRGFSGDSYQMEKILDRQKYDAEVEAIRLKRLNAELSEVE